EDAAREVAGVRYVARRLDGVPAGELRGMVDDLKKGGPGVYAVVTVTDGKASLVVGVTDGLADRLSAIELVRAGVAALGGKGGGGRPDMAQGGGPDGAKADQALDAIERAIGA
ncbi:MAG: alanine--tRNA ligase, partial [Proteobacteria bacterium]|nr:alanine--tRNA ligase [Pseudomonadota bacterium]